MGGKSPESQVDSQFFTQLSFSLNILVCGDYNEKIIESNLENIKIIKNLEGVIGKYKKVGNHKYINEWMYYFIPQDEQIGNNTFDFIENKILDGNSKNLILFYDSDKFKASTLLDYYQNKEEVYHPNFIIVTNNENDFYYNPKKKNIEPDLIKIIPYNDILKLLINIIEICSYYNQLGDEVGFPKRLIDRNLLDEDSKLMTKYLFTLNFIVCGKPGVGKSCFINKILGKNKCLSTKGDVSITNRVTKYIHSSLPIVFYDTPGFVNEDDIDLVEKLIIEKNNKETEEKNQIHFILYLINTGGERPFIPKEFQFIQKLIKENMEIYFIATHAQNEQNSKNYVKATELTLKREAKKSNIYDFRELANRIFPVELKEFDSYKKFGIKQFFNYLYESNKNQKIEFEINKKNFNEIKSKFFKNIKTETDVINHASSLSLRIINNFTLLASSIGTWANAKGTTPLSSSVIKIIYNIYNKKITSDECLEIISKYGYTNEFENEDTVIRKIEKFTSSIFYKYGPGAAEIEYIGEKCIKKNNEELKNSNIKLYKYINNLRISINSAIDKLKEIQD